MGRIKYAGITAAVLLTVAPVLNQTVAEAATTEATTQLTTDTQADAEQSTSADVPAEAGTQTATSAQEDTQVANDLNSQDQQDTVNTNEKQAQPDTYKLDLLHNLFHKDQTVKPALGLTSVPSKILDTAVSQLSKLPVIGPIINKVAQLLNVKRGLTADEVSQGIQIFVGQQFKNAKDMSTFDTVDANYGNELKKGSESTLTAMGVQNWSGDSKTASEFLKKVLDSGYSIQVGDSDKDSFEETLKTVKTYGGGRSFTIPMVVKDAKGNVVASQTLQFSNNGESTAPVTDLMIQMQSPYGVDLNSPTLNARLANSFTAQVVDQDGQSVQYEAKPGSIYLDEDSAENNGGKRLTTANFTKDGETYYQPVTLDFGDSSRVNVQELVNSMNNDGSESITVNNEDVRGGDIDGNTVKVIRKIVVGATNGKDTDPNKGVAIDWVKTDKDGVVTVPNGGARIYNDDNQPVMTRSLAQGTDWRTDQYRTDPKTNTIEYRVSTHEWVKASDVDLTQSNANEATGVSNNLGVVSNLKGKHAINLAGPKKFVYTLFKANGSKSTRGLGGSTSWATDKVATNANGDKFYRVSTNEWVKMGTGVSFN